VAAEEEDGSNNGEGKEPELIKIRDLLSLQNNHFACLRQTLHNGKKFLDIAYNSHNSTDSSPNSQFQTPHSSLFEFFFIFPFQSIVLYIYIYIYTSIPLLRVSHQAANLRAIILFLPMKIIKNKKKYYKNYI
jgi:hypothetical protein